MLSMSLETESSLLWSNKVTETVFHRSLCPDYLHHRHQSRRRLSFVTRQRTLGMSLETESSLLWSNKVTANVLHRSLCPDYLHHRHQSRRRLSFVTQQRTLRLPDSIEQSGDAVDQDGQHVLTEQAAATELYQSHHPDYVHHRHESRPRLNFDKSTFARDLIPYPRSITTYVALIHYTAGPPTNMESHFRKGELIQYRLEFGSPWEVGTYERKYSRLMKERKWERVVSDFLRCPVYAHGGTSLEWRPFPGKSIATYFIRPCLNLFSG